ncbi:MAG: hypothetical protein AAGH15_28210 [Myxococcota bacterium]
MQRDPEKLEAELTRLRKNLADLRVDWERLRYAPAGLVLVVPGFLAAGPLGAIVALILVMSLVATAAYLIGVRRREYAQEIADVKRELAMSQPPPPPTTPG